jgi:hypothetical protein
VREFIERNILLASNLEAGSPSAQQLFDGRNEFRRAGYDFAVEMLHPRGVRTDDGASMVKVTP